MDKIQALLKATKPTSKLVTQKKVIEEQHKKFVEENMQDQKIMKEKKEKHLQAMEQFFEFDTRKKKVKLNEEEGEPTMTVSVEEAKTRLRELQQPITLFAESPKGRLKRLAKAEEFHKKYPDCDMKTYDDEFQYKLKWEEDLAELEIKYRDRLLEPRLGDNPFNLERKKEMIKKEEVEPLQFEQVCDEVLLWIHKIVKDWKESLQKKYDTPELRDKYQINYGRFQDSESDINGFMQVLRQKKGDKEMIKGVYYIVNCCLIREYIVANDRYMDLAIGNAPWPLGIAMLSITVKRNGPHVSHVLSSETSRKWMLVVKRLIAVSQELYPNVVDDYKKVGYSVKSMI